MCSRSSRSGLSGSPPSATSPTRLPRVSLECVSFRDHTALSGGQVDDTPFGGGAGMVLRVDVVDSALGAHYGADPVALARAAAGHRAGPRWAAARRALVSELAAEPALTLLCGRYEGFDERVIEHLCSDVVSIGRYVLAGGELAAMVVCDAVLRKLPGALGHEESAVRGVIQRGAGWQPRVSALHPPRRVSRLAGARGPALGPSSSGSSSGVRSTAASAGGRLTTASDDRVRGGAAGRGRSPLRC